jgi:hypothetical protein
MVVYYGLVNVVECICCGCKRDGHFDENNYGGLQFPFSPFIRNRPPFNRPPFNPVNKPLKRKFIQEKSVSPVKKVKSNITKKSRK